MRCVNCGEPSQACRNCGEPIARCKLPGQPTPCWYHPGNGWHRCDGKPVDAVHPASVAEPVTAITSGGQ